MLSAYFMELFKEFREFSRINFCSGMKSKFFHIFVTKIPGGKIQLCPRNFTNIAEINQKIHEICRKYAFSANPSSHVT